MCKKCHCNTFRFAKCPTLTILLYVRKLTFTISISFCEKTHDFAFFKSQSASFPLTKSCWI